MARSIPHSITVPCRGLTALRAWLVLPPLLCQLTASTQTVTSAVERWSSYLGGVADDQVMSMATDAFGHVYVAGRTSEGLLLGNDTTGQSGLTHQNTYGGGASDAFLAKIAPQGSVLWCTYFGGAGDDEAVSVVVTGMEGVYLVGHTTSTEGIATDSLAFQGTPGGGSDLFIARFTEFGLLVGATYFGGAGDETAGGSTLDALGRLMVGGSANDANAFGAMPVNQAYAGGLDGVLLRFHGTDSLIAGTYLGGEGDDGVVHIVQGDSTGTVLVGNTTSTQNIATDDALTATLQGSTDGFLLKVDTNLAVMHGTYIGGPADDEVQGLAMSAMSIALCGTTLSDSLHTDTTSYQAGNAGGGDGFIVMLDHELALLWSTFIGDTAYDALTAVAFDNLGRCYAAGITASNSSIAIGTVTGSWLLGASDGFVLRFDSAGTPGWSRYVGALGEEEARTFCIKGETSIFLGGSTTSTEDFAHEGHQMSYGGGDRDGAAMRLDQVTSTLCAGICTGTSGSSGGGGSYNGVTPPLDELHLCLGEQITLIVYGGALGAFAEWMWYADECGQPDHFLTSGDTITLSPTASFTLWVRAESLLHTTACRALQVVVHNYPQPVVVVSDTVCPGADILLAGTEADTFTWLVADSLLTGATVQLPAPMQSGTIDVVVTAINGPACSVVDTIPVVVLPQPTTTWQVTDVSCHGLADGMIELIAPLPDAVQIMWADTTLSGSPVLPLAAGTYVVSVTDSTGCTRTDSLLVNMPAALMDSVSVTTALCGGPTGTAQVHGTSTALGLVHLLDGASLSGPLIEGLLPGAYTVTASDSSGCLAELTFVITVEGSITVSAGDTLVLENGSGELQAFIQPGDSLATYVWSPADGLDDPTAASTGIQVNDTATYVVTVTSSAGCSAVDSVVVAPLFTVLPIPPTPCGEAFLPDMFSPNGDGLNDVLCVLGGCYTAVNVMVYDRWGQAVFRSTDPAFCWDGRLNGTLLPAGPYALTFSAERTNGETVEHQGTITLRR